MRLTLLILFFSIFFPCIAYTQYKENSLYRVYEKTAFFFSSDTAQVGMWIKAAKAIPGTNTPADHITLGSNLKLLEKAKKLSLSIGYTKGVVASLLELSSYYNYIYNYKKAREFLREAYPYCMNLPMPWRNYYRLRLDIGMANTYMWVTEKDSAMIYFRKAESTAIDAKDIASLIIIYFNMGSTWLSEGNTNNALYYLKKAEKLSPKGDSTYIGPIYNNLASIYNEKSQLDSAYYYASKALTISQQKNWIFQQEVACNSLGNIFTRAEKNDSAMVYFQKAIALQTGNTQYRRLSLWGLGDIAYKQKDIKKAIQYALQGAEVDKSVFLKTASSLKFYHALSILYTELGDFKSAYKYQVKFSNLRDSAYKIERSKAMDKLETQWRVAEKDKELTEKEMLLIKEKGKIKSRNIWIVGTSLCIISIAILFFSFYRNSKRKIHILKQQEEINKLKAVVYGEEKERNRIAKELHDGIGGLISAAAINLNTLCDEVPVVGQNHIYQKTKMLIGAIGHDVRKTAHNLIPDILLRHNLPEAIRLFCTYVQKEGRLNIKILENGSFEQMQQDFLLSVYRIVQELVQNIVKHAQASNAFIQLDTDEIMMSITVEDDGIGYDTEKAGKGMGLKNIQDRVKAMNGTINIASSNDKGTSVYIEFDINNT